MRKISLIALTFFIGFHQLSAQKYRDLFIHVDSSEFGKSNRFFVDITLINKRGKQTVIDKTSSNFDWKKVKVKVSELLIYNNGICHYKATNVHKLNRSCSIEVSDKNGVISKKITFDLPYVSEIILNKSTVVSNQDTKIDGSFKFNNGQVIAMDENLFDFSAVTISAFNTEIKRKYPSFFKLDLDKPYPESQIQLTFIHNASNEILYNNKLTISYPSTAEFNFSGFNGNSGRSGSSGSFPSGSASSGEHGESGGNSKSAKFFVYNESLNGENYLIIKVFTDRKETVNQVLAYKGEAIRIYAQGGNGGNGGNGGKGGDGKIDKTNNIDSPKAGDGGNGGNGGDGGNGGNIIVYFSESSFVNAPKFEGFTEAGAAGQNGALGTAGQGDYSETKLIGTLLSNKSGADGTAGNYGSQGKTGTFETVKVLDKDFRQLLQQYLETGY